MSETLRPETEAQLVDALAWVNSEESPVEIISAGTKRSLGRPVQAAQTLDLSAFSGVTLYEPEELVLAAGPATPLAEIEALLAEQNQQLAYEPPDLSGLLGTEPKGTLAGVIACNLAGPRRIKDGAARDHFLGFDAVSGRAQPVKSGGRVMKNVTGYDLSKLLCGSYGTLAAMTKVTMKVLPRGEKTYTVLVRGVEAKHGIAALTKGLNGPFEVSGATWLPASVAGRSSIDLVRDPGTSVAALRLEGFGPSVAYRCGKLRELLANYGETEELHSHNSQAFWQEIRNVTAFHQDQRAVWRVSTAPAAAADLVQDLAGLPAFEAYCDWGGGMVWLAVDAGQDAQASAIRSAVAKVGGYATLVRADAGIRSAVPVFHPQPGPLAALSKRLKESFDPNGILNPGRMAE